MRVAYCLSGLVGGFSGKNSDKNFDKEQVLKICRDSIFKNTDVELDFFIHSWNLELENLFIDLFKPKKIILENQIKFGVPLYVENTDRVQNHYSRWYSNYIVNYIRSNYEFENDFKYDLVLTTRFDIFWLKNIGFKKLDASKIYIAKTYKKYTNRFYGLDDGGLDPYNEQESTDHMFCSNSENSNLFNSLYNNLEEYLKPNECPNWQGISSHFLFPWHLRKINLLNEMKRIWLHYGYAQDVNLYTNSDYSIIRYLPTSFYE